MEKLLKEILVELKSLNQNITKLSNGYDVYDICSAVENVSSKIDDLTTSIKNKE